MKRTQTLLAGSVLAGIAVIAGAFGAHALEEIVSADRLMTWETAVQYQMYHALALIIVGILQQLMPDQKLLARVPVFFIIGITIFSGSLYALVLLDISWLGAITPIGGISFIVGWAVLGYAVIKGEKGN